MISVWAIEKLDSDSGLPEYFTGKYSPSLRWSDLGNHACLFSRKEDAERIAVWLDPACRWRIAEYGWTIDGHNLVEKAVEDTIGLLPHGPTFIPGTIAAKHAELEKQLADAKESEKKLRDAITEHHAQKADDRCIEDDDKLYAAAGLPPCDRRVGDKTAMLENCKRFIERRCESGGWASYAELEKQLAAAKEELKTLKEERRGRSVHTAGDTLDM